MAKLLVHESSGIREVELVDNEIHLGRELDNTIRLADPSVSRHHAVIRKTASGWECQDLQSSNGVLLNGVRVQTCALKDGDRLTLGQMQLTFNNPAHAEEAAQSPRESIPETPLSTMRMSLDEMAAQHGAPAMRPTMEVPPIPPPPTMPPPPPFSANETVPPPPPSTPITSANPVIPPPPSASPVPAQPSGPPVFGHFTNHGETPMNTITKPDANPILAALLTWFVFGCGHLVVNGQQRKWIYTLIATFVGMILCVLPGVIIGVLSVIDSYLTAQRLQNGESIPENEYSMPLLYKIISMIDKEATCSQA